MDKKRVFSLSLTLIIVMLFSAMGPTTVYADDGTSTDPPPAETSDTDGETSEEGTTEEQADETGEGEIDEAVTEEEVTEEPAGETAEEQVGETVASEEGTDELPAEEGADEATAEEPSLMEQVPENTEVVVLNAEGEAEPLATQEAADAVVESDPIWCPAGQAPTPGANGCTDTHSSFDALLTTLKADEGGDALYQGNGTIYVEMGNYAGGESSIDFNSYGFTTFDDNDLTIQGGWNTSTGTTTDTTSFDVPMVIGSQSNPWGGSLTINDIIISGTDDVGLTVYSAGSVTIEDSEFTQNDKAGVFIDADEDVTVRRSKINDNGSNSTAWADGKGLEIQSGGYVSLSDIEANDNQIFGADIQAVTGVAIENSFFNGNLMYTNDGDFFGYGLKVVSTQGDIALSGVEANENYLWGAWLDGPIVFIRDSKFNANKSDSDVFIDDTGLIVISTGDVGLRDVEANDNRMIGADIEAGGQISIRDSFFNRNFGTTVDPDTSVETYWGYGLQAVSTGDSISLDVVEVNDNYLFGANLDAGGDVTVTGSSISRNATPGDQSAWGLSNKPVINNIELDLVPSGGLMIQSGGNVTLSTVSVNDNLMFGADIEAVGFVDIEDAVFNNNLNGAGLTAKSTTDDIRLTNVTTLGNGADGANLETPCDVWVTGGTFAGNASYGIYAATRALYLSVGTPPSFSPANGIGETFVVAPPGACPASGSSPNPVTVVASLTEGQLPAPLEQGNAFVSALQVSSSVTNISITLSFPIPAGMEDADLAVLLWDGSGWVEVSGGSVVGGEFVITVNQPGIYVLVAQ